MLAEIAILIWGPSAADAGAKIAEITAATTSGKPDISWQWDADIGIHWAALVNAGLLAVLFATAGWWTRELPTRKAPIRSGTPRWFWPALAVAMLLGLGMRMPLASKSLWWDEAWVIRQCSHGSWKPDKKVPEVLKFSPTDWKRCAFYYQKPTNHVPMSLAQKASLQTWHKMSGAETGAFSDLAARVPALLASTAAVGLCGVLLHAWGFTLAGVLGATLLALHPMAIRYGVDARAYALVIPLALSALLAITCLIQTHGQRVRHWVWLALNQWIWLWAYPNAGVDILFIVVALAVVMWRQESACKDKVAATLRVIVAHAFAAMLLLQSFLPNLLQARRWAGQEADKHLLDPPLLRSTLNQLMSGIEWREETAAAVEGAGLPQMASFFGLSPATGAVLLILALALAIMGWVMLWRNQALSRWLACTLLAAVTFAAITRLAETYFYPRFVVALVPAITIGWAAMIAHWFAGNRRFFGVLGLTILGILFVPGWYLYATRPYAPLREVAEWISSQQGPKPVVLAYGHGREAYAVYDPHCHQIETAAQLEAELVSGKGQGRDVLVVIGHNSFNRALLASGYALLDDPLQFKEVAHFSGIESEHYFRVFKAIQ